VHYKLGTKTNFKVNPTIILLKFYPNFEINEKQSIDLLENFNSKTTNHKFGRDDRVMEN